MPHPRSGLVNVYGPSAPVYVKSYDLLKESRGNRCEFLRPHMGSSKYEIGALLKVTTESVSGEIIIGWGLD